MVTAAILSVIVAIVVVATHWTALSSQALCIDDQQYLTDNDLVQNPSWQSVRRFFGEVLDPSTVGGYYQPLAMTSLMLDYAIAGRADNLRPFHRTSLALHAINAAMMVVFLHLLFGRPWVAAGAGLLFGLHPLTVETICWVAERKTLLATFFSLCCLVSYVGYARRRNRVFAILCVAAYALALLSKPTATPLPLVLLLLDYWPLNRLSWRGVLEKLPLFVIGGISAAVTLISQARTARVQTPGQYPLVEIPLVICHNVLFYLRKVVWPSHLSSHYPFPEPVALSDGAVLAGVIATPILLAALAISLRWTRALAIAWLVFFILILPTMQIVSFSNAIAADKYVYLPFVGFLLALAWFLGRIADGAPGTRASGYARGFVIGALVLVAGAEAVATRLYTRRWSDTVGLYQYMLTLAPRSHMLHYNLGCALAKRGDTTAAMACYEEALRLQPDAPEPAIRLGAALAENKRYDEATAYLERALKIAPRSSEAHGALANVLSRQNKPDLAIRHYEEALRLRPRSPEMHNNFGLALLRSGRPAEAIEHFGEAARLDPNYGRAKTNMGIALAQTGHVRDAIPFFEAVVRLQPGRAEPHINLGGALLQNGQPAAAADAFRTALRLQPDSPAAQAGLKAAMGQIRGAGASTEAPLSDSGDTQR